MTWSHDRKSQSTLEESILTQNAILSFQQVTINLISQMELVKLSNYFINSFRMFNNVVLRRKQTNCCNCHKFGRLNLSIEVGEPRSKFLSATINARHRPNKIRSIEVWKIIDRSLSQPLILKKGSTKVRSNPRPKIFAASRLMKHRSKKVQSIEVRQTLERNFE